jgi:hypothetical protein
MTSKILRILKNYGLAAIVAATAMYQISRDKLPEDKSLKSYDSKTEHVILKDTDYDGFYDYKVVYTGPRWGSKNMTVYVKDTYKHVFEETPRGKVIVIPDSTILE